MTDVVERIAWGIALVAMILGISTLVVLVGSLIHGWWHGYD